MKPRLVILLVAVVLGAITALGVNMYLNNIRQQAVEEQKTVQVWVAKGDIEKGASLEDIQKNQLAELKNIPQRYVAMQAITTTASVEGQVLSVPVGAGEQLTVGKFRYPSEAGLAYSIPKDNIAVSIPFDTVKGVAGMVRPGDLVTIFATFNPGPDGENETKIILQKVKVLAVGDKVGAEKEGANSKAVAAAQTPVGNSGDQKSITLALSPQDAEKLIFAQENGKVWLGLHTSTDAAAASTSGMTIKTVFK